MFTLAIEVSNPSSGPRASEVALGVLCAQHAEVLGVETVEPGSRERDDLIPACDRLLKRLGKQPGDLGAIAVDIGPGGFTGLRIAVAGAAAMGQTLGIGIIAVPASRVAAIDAASSDSGAFMVMLATKRQTGYAQVFDARGVPMGEGKAMDVSALQAFTPPACDGGEQASANSFRLIADDHLPIEFAQVARARGWSIEPICLSATNLLHAAAAAMDEKRTPAEALVPIYAREPEAVTLWRERHGGG